MYAIWILPHTDKDKELAQLIIKLSQEHDGPCFSPHITLLSGLQGNEKELIIKTSELAAKLTTLSVKTDVVETQDSYYKSLYLKIIETKLLLESRRQAESLFHPQPVDEFMPHLSLLYGNQSEQVKRQIIASLKDKTRLDLLMDRVALVSAMGPPEKWITISTERLY